MRFVKIQKFLLLEILLATGIFFIDLYTPRGIADAISYVALVILTLWTSRKSHTVIAAVGGTLLTLAGGVFSPDSDMPLVFLINRALAIVGIWVAALVILLFKRSQSESKRLRDSLNALFTYATEGIIIVNSQKQIDLINPKAENQFGYAPAELIGSSVDKLFPGQKLVLANDDTTRASAEALEYTARRKDGSEFPAEISRSAYQLDDQQFTVSFVIDISERKKREAELRQSHEELKRYAVMLKETNAELESFAYISSHDLQEPLRKIQSFGSRLQTSEKQNLSEEGQDYLDRIVNAAVRMQNLINDLLTYSRLTTRDKVRAEVDLNQVAREVLSDLEVAIEHNQARVETESLPRITAEPVQMRQLFQNLIGNAIKFRKKEEEPMIRIWYKEVRYDEHDYVELYFEDNGIGFDEKYAEKIFGIFQRLEGGKYDGSGIGLTICKKIAARHGGIITAKSKPGQGSIFKVTLPARPLPLNTTVNAQQIENN